LGYSARRSSRDFDIRKELTNLTALRKVGFTANRRLLHVEHISHDPAAGAAAFTAVTAQADIAGQHAAGLRFGDPRAQALLAVLLVFRLQPGGFTNADLRTHLASRATHRLRPTNTHTPTRRHPRIRHRTGPAHAIRRPCRMNPRHSPGSQLPPHKLDRIKTTSSSKAL
jgi:hypothetical protein